VIFNRVLDTTFKDTTTLPMELLKRLLKLGIKKKAPREGHSLSEQPFLDISPVHRVPPDFDPVVVAFPSLVEYHLCDPNILTRLKKRANSWNLRIF
jgi:hypothetical protein